MQTTYMVSHDDVIEWKHFPRYWPFVRGIHWSPVNSPHKGQWHGALMFSLICVWVIGWVNNREAGDLRRICAHYDATLMHKFHGDIVVHYCLTSLALIQRKTRSVKSMYCFQCQKDSYYHCFVVHERCLRDQGLVCWQPTSLILR